MISRRTIVWFLLLLGFSAGIEYDQWEVDRPCREWKAAHPGVDPKTDADKDELLPDGTHEMSFNPCNVTLWRSMPLWMRCCALGCLVSLIEFVHALSVDTFRWSIRRRFSWKFGDWVGRFLLCRQ